MLRTAYAPPPVLTSYVPPVMLPSVPGIGSHSYLELPSEQVPTNLPSSQVPVPPRQDLETLLATAHPDKPPKMDVSVFYFNEHSPEGHPPPPKYYGPPPKEDDHIPHGSPIPLPREPSVIGPRLLATLPKLDERMFDQSHLDQFGQNKDGPMAKKGVKAVVIGRYIPRTTREEPILAYGEMRHLPAGYEPGPPGFGYENYLRRPAPQPSGNSPFPDVPMGVPLSHGHPSFLGRSWLDSAPYEPPSGISKRQASATGLGSRQPSSQLQRKGSKGSGKGKGKGVRFSRQTSSQPPEPRPGEGLLNPHSTVAEREYEARVVFRRFDADNNDVLDLDEFVRAMNYLGVPLTYDDAQAIYAMFDEDGSGTMDEEEFVRNFLNNYC